MANPKRRLATNTPGDVYVDDTCIDCGTCRWMAPATFDRAGQAARVHTQPEEPAAIARALEALVSCPTSSIGTITRHDVRATVRRFPLPHHGRVFHTGFHAASSYGATSWFIERPEGNYLIDSPRFARPLVRQLESRGGVDWLFLTHRDDVADHQKFADHFGCQRIMHRDDASTATAGIEHWLDGQHPIQLASGMTAIPTPGHTRGSTCLHVDDTYLFTGDTLAWRHEQGHLHAFRDACWFDWSTLKASLEGLRQLTFSWVLPGHGAPHHASPAQMQIDLDACIEAM